jgi:hypothetical protein
MTLVLDRLADAGGAPLIEPVASNRLPDLTPAGPPDAGSASLIEAVPCKTELPETSNSGLTFGSSRRMVQLRPWVGDASPDILCNKQAFHPSWLSAYSKISSYGRADIKKKNKEPQGRKIQI